MGGMDARRERPIEHPGHQENATWWQNEWLYGETKMSDPEADWTDEPDLYCIGKKTAGRPRMERGAAIKERPILAGKTLVGQWVRHPILIDRLDSIHNNISGGLGIPKLRERVIRDYSIEADRSRLIFFLGRDISNCGYIARLEGAAIHSPTVNFTCAHPSLHPFMSARIVA